MVSEIVITQGKSQYKVNLQGTSIWYALMWGWWPNGGSTPSYRWQRVESVPKRIEEEYKKCLAKMKQGIW